MIFHTFADGTMVKLSSIEAISSILPESEIPKSVGPLSIPEDSYAYRIISLGFSGAAGSNVSFNPLLRVSTDLQALTAERDALIAAVTSV